MGREIRMVPRGWRHPRDRHRQYVPLFAPADVKALLEKWLAGYGLWLDGKHPDQLDKNLATDGISFSGWDGGPPDPDDYMPNWPKSERTHFQYYECTTEGTPLSPSFSTMDLLARWCVENEGGTHEDWMRFGPHV